MNVSDLPVCSPSISLGLLQPLWAIEMDEAAFNACFCNLNYKLKVDSAQSLVEFVRGNESLSVP